MNNIFVGNLAFTATKEDVQKLFEPFGAVANVVIMERKKGKSRGYGFVDMPNEEEKNKAIAALHGKEFMWRVIEVSVVIPKAKGEFRPKKRRVEGVSKPWVKHESGKPYQSHSKPSAWGKINNDFQSKEGKPWRKSEGGSKPPYKKFDHARPAENSRREGRPTGKPWVKREGGGDRPAGGKFYHREEDREARPPRQGKPWVKREGVPKSPYKKFDGKPTTKRAGPSKPFSKPGGAFKMFHKMSKVAKFVPKGKARS